MSRPFISEDQLHFFAAQGYVALRQAIPPDLLLRLRKLTESLMQGTEAEHRAAHKIDGQDFVHNLPNICQSGDLTALECLGTPFVGLIAADICGPDFFPIHDYAVVKMLGDPTPILWHQDMLHKRTGNAFFMGLYLDDAAEQDGALRVVPGSHTSGKDICLLKDEPSIELPMQAGDVLVHDLMLAHSSSPMKQNPLRRVLYFEFLSAKQVQAEGIYPEYVVQARTQLMHLAQQHYQQVHDIQTIIAEKTPPSEQNEQLRSALKQVYETRFIPHASAYCHQY